MSVRQDVHPITFGIGFWAAALNLAEQHPSPIEKYVSPLIFSMYLLLQQWGLRMTEVEQARDLFLYLGTHEPQRVPDYQEAAQAFARSTPARKRLWCMHMQAVTALQARLTGKEEIPITQVLRLEHMRLRLGLDQETYMQLAQEAVGWSIAIALIIGR